MTEKNYLSVSLEVRIESSISRRTGQGSTLPDEDKHKTKLSTFKPKALRNPKTFKNLQNAVGKENSQGSSEDLTKKDGFGNPLFGNLKPMVPNTKVSKEPIMENARIRKLLYNFSNNTFFQDYDEVLRDEALKKIPINLKPVQGKSTAQT